MKALFWLAVAAWVAAWFVLGYATAADMIEVHATDGLRLYLNAEAIVVIRPPRDAEKLVHKEVNCLIMTSDGKFTSTVEACDVIRGKLKK